MKLNQLKIALVYDRLVKWGGAERLLSFFSSLLPQADFFTLKYKPQPALAFLNHHKVITSFLDKFPFKFIGHELLFPLSGLAFEQFNFEGYDLVISIGSAESKSIITRPETKHLHYALSATRYLWQDYHLFKKQLPHLPRLIFSLSASGQRRADFIMAQRPDKIIAISAYIQKQILKYYRRQAEVIYPPFDPSYWYDLRRQPIIPPVKEPFWLSVSRLVPQKRLDLIIKAAALSHQPMIMVGKGWLKGRLNSLIKKLKAPATIISDITDGQLKHLYLACKGVIMPQVEDYGYVGLEAAALSRPIIYFNQGGLAEILANYPYGYPFENQSAQNIVRAIKRVKSVPASNWLTSSKIKTYFKPFKPSVFKKQLLCLINDLTKGD